MVTFHGIQDCEELSLCCGDVSNGFCGCSGLIQFTLHIAIQMGEVHTHADIVRVFLGGYNDWGTPFSNQSDVLFLKEFQLSLQFLTACKRDGSWCADTKWLCIVREVDMKLLTSHYFDVSFGNSLIICSCVIGICWCMEVVLGLLVQL